MKKRGHIKWIVLLMGVSQLLLTGFVIYWLANQYRQEKDSLQSELQRSFLQSQDEVMDSALVIQVIDPLMKDSLIASDSISGFHFITDPVVYDSIPAGSGKILINIQESFSSGMEKQNERMLLRSFKLIMGRTHSNIIPDSIDLHIDTSHVRQVFLNRLPVKGQHRMVVTWITGDDTTNMLKAQRAFHFQSGILHPEISMEVSKYRGYLVMQIWPQILFGLLLLILTGAAFLITWRSLKKQMELELLRAGMMSNLSHELKTPVSTVKVALEALNTFRVKDDPVMTGEYLGMMQTEIDRLDQLIHKVIRQTQLQGNRMTIQPEPTDLSSLAHQVVQTIHPRLEQENVRVEWVGDEQVYTVNADRLLLQGALINLIDNSIKYGKDQVVIRLRLFKELASVGIEVQDNGPGIPGIYRKRIFDQFFRIPSGDRHNVKGYGLGLSFVAMVMEAHKGTVKLDQTPEGGAVFRLKFPIPDYEA